VEETAAFSSKATIVQDLTGRLVSFDQIPRRVVIFPILQPTYATIDETTQNIAAMPNFMRQQADAALLSHVFPRMPLIPTTGRTFGPDVEWILRYQPDAVIVEKSASEMLDRIGFRGVVKINYALSNYRIARMDMWRLIGAITGKGGRAQLLLDRFHRKMEALLIHLSEIKVGPARLIVPSVMGNGRWAVATNYYLNETFETSGGVNVARGLPSYANLDFEQFYRLNPDVIIIGYYKDGPIPQMLYDDPLWQPVRAVHDRHVYLMPMNFLDNIAVDEPLLLTWLAEIFHPDSMPRMTRAAYREAYAQVYHYDLTDDEIDHALFFKENSASAGYERFKAQ